MTGKFSWPASNSHPQKAGPVSSPGRRGGEKLFGSPFPEENEKQRLREQCRRDVAAQNEPEGELEIEPIGAPWAAAAAEVVDCPGQLDVQLVKANGRLSFNPQSRQVTPAQRQEILRRDGCPLRGHEAKNPCGASAPCRTEHIFSGCAFTTLSTGRTGVLPCRLDRIAVTFGA